MSNDINQDLGSVLVKIRTALILLVVPVLVWIFWSATESPGPHDVVALDHALVAQNVVSGKGMTSPVVTPLHLSLGGELDNAGPVFAKPLFVLWESLLFRVRYASGNMAGLASGIPWVLASWLVFFLAARVHTAETGWLCFFVFLLNPYVLDLSTAGRPETMGMVLVCLLAVILSKSPPDDTAFSPPLFSCLTSGFVAGLLMMCIPYIAPGLLLVLSVYWYRWPSRASMEKPLQINEYELDQFTIIREWIKQRFCIRTLSVFLLGFLLPVVIVFIIRLSLSGPLPVSLGGYMITVDTAATPGWSFWRTYHTLDSFWLFWLSSHLSVIFTKMLGGISYGFMALFDTFHPAVFALYIFALFLPEYGEKRGYRWMVVLMVALHILAMSVFYWDKQVLFIWTPVVIVIGVSAFSEFLANRLLKQADEVQYRSVKVRLRSQFVIYYSPMILLLALTAGMFFLRVTDGKRPQKLTPSAALESLTRKQAVYHTIVTPSPWLVAWHSGSRTIWLPETAKGMQQLENAHGDRIAAVYLPRTRAEIFHDKVPSWWFFVLQRQDVIPSYSEASFGAVGEVVYIKPDESTKNE